MDNCFLCGRPIDEGVQYIISLREIRFGSKPWFATDGKHYSFCEECDAWLKEVIKNASRRGNGRARTDSEAL